MFSTKNHLAPSLLRTFLFPVLLMCIFLPQAGAASWKDELKAEEAKNETRIKAIDTEAQPIAAQLRQVNQAIDRHNAQHPDGVCTYPEGHPEVCTPWIREAKELTTAREKLVSQLRPLADESDRLIVRNKEIERRLRCYQPPTACKSDSDCNECGYCSTFDGDGKGPRCSPRP